MEIKILFICDSLRIKTEWLFRLIENLNNDIGCIVANDLNLNRIKIPQKSLNPYSAKIIRKLYEPLNNNYTYPIILNRIEKQYSTNVNYIHFIGFAVKVKKFILESRNPTIIHCHGKDVMWDFKERNTGKPLYDQFYFDSLQIISNKAYFIANSNFTKIQLLKKGIQEERIFISHFGIELPLISSKLTSSVFTVLYLGRLIDCKGPLEVILAFEKACNMGMDGELIMAGGGEMEEECEKARKKSKYKHKIKLLGWVDKHEAENLFRSADIFTAHNKKDKYTNQIEAFGVSIIEAMSFGLPVITGNSGGVKDSVLNNETGYLIESGNVDEHAQKILDLFHNKKLRDQMGEKARLRVKHFFNPLDERKNFYSILKKIVAQERQTKNHV